MTGTPLPAASYFSGSITNSNAKSAQDATLAFIRQSLLGGAAETQLTIASGAVVPTGASHKIETEASAATDVLDHITVTNMIDGQLLLLRCHDASHVVTIDHGAGGSGQILLYGATDLVLNSTSKWVLLKLNGTTWEEVMRNFDTRFVVCGTAGGTTNALTLTPAVAIPSYETQQLYMFTPASNNTSSATVNISGLGVKTFKKLLNGALTNLEANDLVANIPAMAVYDGTQPVLLNPQVDSKDNHGVGIINGNFDIWQRGTSFAVSGGSYQYTADRWKATLGTGTGWTISRNTVSNLTNKYSLKAQRDAAATTTTNFVLQNVFESRDSLAYRDEKLTLLFKIKKGANFSPTSISVGVISGTGTDQTDPNTFTGGTNVISTSIAAADISTSETLVRITSAAVVPSNCNQLAIQIVAVGVGTAGADDSFEISTVYVKRGVCASVPLSRPIELEMQLCERYFEKSFDESVAPAQAAGFVGSHTMPQIAGASASQNWVGVRFRVKKRTTPTITFYNPVSANAQIRNASVNVDSTGALPDGGSIGQSGFGIGGTSGAGSAAGNTNFVHWSASAEI